MSHTTFPSHQLTQNVKLLHKVLLTHKKKFLVLKRSQNSKSRPGKWDLPGGNSEWPEGLQHNSRNLHTLDVAREIWEETGLRFRPDIFTWENQVYFSTFFEAEKSVYTMICGWRVTELTDSQAENVTISDEHSEFSWISRNEASDYDFGGEAGKFIIEIIENGFQHEQHSSNSKSSHHHR